MYDPNALRAAEQALQRARQKEAQTARAARDSYRRFATEVQLTCLQVLRTGLASDPVASVEQKVAAEMEQGATRYEALTRVYRRMTPDEYQHYDAALKKRG